LHGAFGNPPADERAVLIGGLEAAAKEWKEDQIRVALPRTGAGSAGDVVVSVRAHKSNVRRITEWNIQFRYKWSDSAMAPTKVEGPITVRFRADVGDHRDKPGEMPLQPVRHAFGTRDSSGSLQASGTHSDGPCSFTLGGSGDLVPDGYPETASTPAWIASWYKVDAKTKAASIGLALGGAAQPWTTTLACPGGSNTFPYPVLVGQLEGNATFANPIDDAEAVGPLPALNVQLGDAWGIPGGVFEELQETVTIRWEWDAVSAKFPPDPDAAR
jgi:hypothetical protein